MCSARALQQEHRNQQQGVSCQFAKLVQCVSHKRKQLLQLQLCCTVSFARQQLLLAALSLVPVHCTSSCVCVGIAGGALLLQQSHQLD